jgi:hypothetical protein
MCDTIQKFVISNYNEHESDINELFFTVYRSFYWKIFN